MALISLSDFIATSAQSAVMYKFFVEHYGDTRYVAYNTWQTENMATGTTQVLVQLFFVSRIWRLHQIFHPGRKAFNIFIRMVLTVIAIYPYVAIIALTYQDLTTSARQQHTARTHNVDPLYFSSVATSAALDILITAMLTHILRQQPNKFAHRHNPFKRLFIFFITRGVIIVIYQMFVLILPQKLEKSYTWVPVLFCLGKVYANSALMTLNNRQKRKDETTSATNLTSGQITLPYLHVALDDHQPEQLSNSAVALQLLAEPTTAVRAEAE
ncbi:hypothetical protein FA95DRAFT_1197916 [Auriscalpium vulgare]|uniref:Uncharacterized protein n=1 Tax=Auriscalpium vulgare TaxID=40419 RepID=A0ACB8RU86_9AGAM|nr:hypothetical protein FA95DRAFT_1197916 [Auriscalpium vulgare]